MIAWNLAKGQFYPVQEGYRGTRIAVSSKSINNILNIIRRQSQIQLCINDSNMNDNPNYYLLKYSNLLSQYFRKNQVLNIE